MPFNHRHADASPQADWSLYSAGGQRKYLNAAERNRFLAAAAREDQTVKALCMVLAFTGCRISEALSLTVSSVQAEAGIVAIRTLKQRGRIAIREVPVPESLVQELMITRRAQSTQGDPDPLLFPIGRTIAWQQVKAVMAKSGICGLHASPRGLRHGFGVCAIQSGVPLNLVQKWLGHANIATTAIYTNALGPEERVIASRMW